MRNRLTLLIAVFGVMALSNAIVPVLPAFAPGTALQGSVYAAYFFGALVTVLPAGILSDRYGRVPFIRAGLALTLLSGAVLVIPTAPLPAIGVRILEGVGAGLFVPAAMSWVNQQPDHDRLSGRFMASLNLGLVVGLFGTGWLSDMMASSRGGILLFTLFSILPFALSLGFREEPVTAPGGAYRVLESGLHYVWLYLSALILLGATGVVSALYPAYSGSSPALLSLEIGAMNVATLLTVLASSYFRMDPVRALRGVSLLMALSVLAGYLTPWAFIAVGALAGVGIIAQLSFLARTGEPQGTAMGLFNVSTYSGMAALPFLAGVIVQESGDRFLLGFGFTALLCLVVTFTIGRCRCRLE